MFFFYEFNEEINVDLKKKRERIKQDRNPEHVQANLGRDGLNIVVIADLRISNKRAHCSTDTNIVQPQRGVGGNFSVVVYASLPALRREKKSINCSGESEKRKAEKGTPNSEPSR